MNTSVVTIGLGRNILKKGSRERERMSLYAQHLGALHVIVLTRKMHRYSEVQHERNLSVYPTNSKNRFMMLINAFHIAKKIMKDTGNSTTVISAQDPLEIGWLCFILSKLTNACLHILSLVSSCARPPAPPAPQDSTFSDARQIFVLSQNELKILSSYVM
jgi:hypothetical protein